MASEESGSTSQKIKLAAAVVIFVAAGVYGWIQFGKGDVARIAAERAHKCLKCDKAFEYVIQFGDKEPIKCAHCGELSGYQAEKCYWHKDESGKWSMKEDPTFVLLKKRVDDETTEKTYCHDCGREVVGHNPRPTPEAISKANSE